MVTCDHFQAQRKLLSASEASTLGFSPKRAISEMVIKTSVENKQAQQKAEMSAALMMHHVSGVMLFCERSIATYFRLYYALLRSFNCEFEHCEAALPTS